MNNPQTQEWSQIIDINVAHGTHQQRLDLLQKIVAKGDRYLLAEYLIELMIFEDKQEIINGDFEFLDTVLRGDGWIGYSHLSIEQNISEFINRDCTHQRFFDSDQPEFQRILASLESENI
jgi:hypothetical protein